LLHPVARDVHPAAVDLDEPVVDELAGLGAGARPAGPEDDVVEALLEHAEQVLARHALLAVGLGVEVGELLLEEAVDVLGLLLLRELQRVLGGLPAAGPTVLTRGVRATVEGAAPLLVLEDVDAETARDLDLGSGVTSHVFLKPQTRRRFGGRQPLWGTGVTSLMPVTSMPVLWIERMAVSRPEPGPLTSTSTLRTPCSIAPRAAFSAAIWA